jgi:hypothetical protein
VHELISSQAEMPAWTLVLLDTKGIVKNIWVGSMRVGHAPNSGLAQLEQSALPRIESVPYYGLGCSFNGEERWYVNRSRI